MRECLSRAPEDVSFVCLGIDPEQTDRTRV